MKSTIILINLIGIYSHWKWKNCYWLWWQMVSSRWTSHVLAVLHAIEAHSRRLKGTRYWLVDFLLIYGFASFQVITCAFSYFMVLRRFGWNAKQTHLFAYRFQFWIFYLFYHIPFFIHIENYIVKGRNDWQTDCWSMQVSPKLSIVTASKYQLIDDQNLWTNIKCIEIWKKFSSKQKVIRYKIIIIYIFTSNLMRFSINFFNL